MAGIGGWDAVGRSGKGWERMRCDGMGWDVVGGDWKEGVACDRVRMGVRMDLDRIGWGGKEEEVSGVGWVNI